jgi:dipeptidyl aminopeptidase/acylaminoacyl peptidase
VLAFQTASAADAHRLELKDIPNLVGTSELVSASEVAISPDGAWVAYTVSTTSILTRESHQRLFVQPFEGGEPTQIGPQDADSSSPDWAPDSSKLLFFVTSAGHSSAAIWNVAHKTTHVLDTAVRSWPAPEWFSDSSQLLVAIAPHADPAVPSSHPKSPAPMVFTAGDTNRRLDGGHYLGIFSLHNSSDALDFAVMDAATGEAKTVAENVDPNLYNFQLSPDGTKLAYTVTKGEFEYDANNRTLRDIKVVDLQNGSTVIVASDVLGSGFGLSPSWSHNSKMLAVIGGTVHDDSASLPLGSPMFGRPGHCYVIHLEKPGVLHPVGPRSFWRLAKPIWSRDDSSIYVLSSGDGDSPQKIIQLNLATGASQIAGTMPAMSDIDLSGMQNGDGDNVYMAILDPAGETSHGFAFNLDSHQFTEISGGKYTINSLSVSRAGGHAAYSAMDSSHPNNVWVSDRRGEAHQLTHFDPTKEQQEKIGETKSITWEYNGRTLYGTLWLPLNYRAGQRCPTIVDVYPGSQGSGMRNYFRGDPLNGDLSWPAFSARGYAIFWPDFHLRVGDGPHEIAAQIIPALDKLVAMGVADPNGFGVYGRSHGGYSTYALITQTHRFRAAIPSVGFSNAFTAYGQLDDNSSPYVLGLLENDFLGASPWQDRELYIKTSPYFNFEKVTTPVLIQYGEQDRPFAWTSKEAFVALRRLGKTATLLGYPDEGHGVNKPANQVDFTNRALEFFDRYLKPSNLRAGAN